MSIHELGNWLHQLAFVNLDRQWYGYHADVQKFGLLLITMHVNGAGCLKLYPIVMHLPLNNTASSAESVSVNRRPAVFQICHPPM